MPPGRTTGGSSRFSSTSRLANAPLLGTVGETEPGDLVGEEADQLAAVEADRAGALLDDAHDGLERRGLAGAVAAEQRDHLAFAHAELDPVQDVGFPVEGVHVLEADASARRSPAQAWPVPM